MSFSIRRVARFAVRNLAWVLVFPLMTFAADLFHGAVEWFAIVAQGGGVIDFCPLGEGPFSWLVGFHYFRGPAQDDLATYLAPFAAWIWFAASGSFLLERLRPSLAARALVLLFGVIPIAAMSAVLAVGELSASRGALLAVVRDRPLLPFAVTALGALFIGPLTWRHFRRLWGGLSAAEFALGYAALIIAPWLLLLLVPRS